MVKRDQIHGDIEFSDAEARFISSRSFDRLKYIKQLGFVDSQFPGAVHNRYQHSLGVCKCVTDMYEAVCKNTNNAFYRDGDVELLRFIALTHDIAHAPFSHASEELSEYSHEDYMGKILEYERNNIVLAQDYEIPSWQLIYEVYNGIGLTYASDSHLVALHSFMDGFIDADKLDYLERDSLNCGVHYGMFDRQGLINSLTIVRNSKGVETLAITSDGVQAFESFLLARYYMFSHVYTSPDERILRYQFVKEMKDLLTGGKYPTDVRKFLQLDDTKYVRRLKCLQGVPYVLVYDGEYSQDTKNLIDRKLKKYLLTDVVHKNIFRGSTDDPTVLVVDKVTGLVKPISEVSPVIKAIEFASIHRLRYYAPKDVATEVKGELLKLLGGDFSAVG